MYVQYILAGLVYLGEGFLFLLILGLASLVLQALNIKPIIFADLMLPLLFCPKVRSYVFIICRSLTHLSLVMTSPDSALCSVFDLLSSFFTEFRFFSVEHHVIFGGPLEGLVILLHVLSVLSR